VPPTNNNNNKHKRAVAPGGFVGAAGATDCSKAIKFTSSNGELFANGRVISTSPDIQYRPLEASPAVGSITTFWRTRNNAVFWFNAQFSSGVALFCQEPSGTVWVIFDGQLPPFTCSLVELKVVPASECTPSDLGATLSLGWNTYAFPHGTPLGEVCATKTRSWINGETTLLRPAHPGPTAKMRMF
jgi:hypothetical protein